MGGKNAIIVDADADLDEAVLGVVKSAFGYQGQKCSACSRVIVLDSVYDTFLERLVEATRSLKIGPAEDPAASMSAVIDAESFERIHKYIEIGRQTGREALAVDVGTLADEGFYVGPHIFTDVPPDGRLAQEEIFGPVLCVFRVADLDEAIRLFNGTDYALTGGIFSRSPNHFERARRELLVGNLYSEPRHHRSAGRPAAVRRLSPLGHRHQGRRARLPAAVRRAAHHHRKHDAPRLRSRGRRKPGRVTMHLGRRTSKETLKQRHVSCRWRFNGPPRQFARA